MENFNDFSHVFGTHKTYILELHLIWELGKKDSGRYLHIPKGTTFDISVPKYLEFLQSPHDRQVLPAALIHDYLLNSGYDKAFASAEFRRALSARKVSIQRAWLLFALTLIWTTT